MIVGVIGIAGVNKEDGMVHCFSHVLLLYMCSALVPFSHVYCKSTASCHWPFGVDGRGGCGIVLLLCLSV